MLFCRDFPAFQALAIEGKEGGAKPFDWFTFEEPLSLDTWPNYLIFMAQYEGAGSIKLLGTTAEKETVITGPYQVGIFALDRPYREFALVSERSDSCSGWIDLSYGTWSALTLSAFGYFIGREIFLQS